LRENEMVDEMVKDGKWNENNMMNLSLLIFLHLHPNLRPDDIRKERRNDQLIDWFPISLLSFGIDKNLI